MPLYSKVHFLVSCKRWVFTAVPLDIVVVAMLSWKSNGSDQNFCVCPHHYHSHRVTFTDESHKCSRFVRKMVRLFFLGGGDTATKSRHVNAGMHKRYPTILLVVIDHLSLYIAISHKCSRCVGLITVWLFFWGGGGGYSNLLPKVGMWWLVCTGNIQIILLVVLVIDHFYTV